MSDMAGIYVKRHMPIIWNVCIPVSVLTLLIPVSSWGICSDICLISTHDAIGICGIYVTFEGHVCCWHIYGNSMVNKSLLFCFVLLVCAVMWGLYVDYSISTWEQICTVLHACLLWAYASNVKCMYTSVCAHIVDCLWVDKAHILI